MQGVVQGVLEDAFDAREELLAQKSSAPTHAAQRSPASHATAKEKVYAYLASRPAGADADELISLLLSGAGSDPELGARLVRTLLGEDPNFIFDPETALWSLRASAGLRIPLDEARFTVVDLETTGGRAGPGTIIEIGAWRMVGRRMVESFESLVRPHRAIPRFITRLTSITDEMVRDAPRIEEVAPAFREFLGDSVMVAHNAAFDFSFLDFEFRRIFGLGLNNPVVCTLRMARRFLPSLRRQTPRRARGAFRAFDRGPSSRPGRRADGGGNPFHLSRDGRPDGPDAAGPPARRPSARRRRPPYRAPRRAGGDRGAPERARRLPDAQRSAATCSTSARRAGLGIASARISIPPSARRPPT